ncbi:hypothetical protein PBI_GAIA_177 [Mycobacterium phage Gaia]|uniref:Uncharacterized protein n=1 Tax=Mycobacterium phage Gaia TaxID=1486472 RepID=A0A068F3R0_9CAUD|nr:hypothetical protein VC46_gp059 [Mycobacterium phage Gaia]AID58993.1 hypothetical protein PBI_GAIA_177 [Mycobacterium phage Gaia]
MNPLIQNAPITRDPWTDQEYMDELLEQIRAGFPKPIINLTVDRDTKVITIWVGEKLTVPEFNRFNKNHWPVDISVEYA